jgi:predicted kinase
MYLVGDNMKLIIFSGLPGTGKSTLAEALGRQFGIPVFAKDWLEAVLLRNGLQPTFGEKTLGYVGYELLTVLAERQLILGQSVILDSVASTQTIREAWHDLANQYAAHWCVIECICSNETLHQKRLKGRKRNIPGWHELKWSDVENVKRYYQTWDEDHLVLDMANSIDENISRSKSYCG